MEDIICHVAFVFKKNKNKTWYKTMVLIQINDGGSDQGDNNGEK